jgi:RNA polymerase sigma-70 factor, ECF subfamily
MVRVQADDPTAFGFLFDRHYGRAFAVAGSVCRDRGRAEDAVQEGFLSIWRSRSSYEPARGSFQAWSMAMIRHRALDSVRAEAAARRPRLAAVERLDTVATPRSVQDDAIAKNESDALRASLRNLPDAQSEVITLAFYGGLSHSEIATQLELPTGTVKGRMRLGLDKLRGANEAADRFG